MTIPKHISRYLGGILTLGCIALFVISPSFPTPDKLLVLSTGIAMMFGQAKELLKRFVPFVVLLLSYESFRGLVPYLNDRVNYMWMPDMDKLMTFGYLPTKVLQNVLWDGTVAWYDFVLYLAYMLHFVIPLGLAVYIWKRKVTQYWTVVAGYIVVSYMGFLTFLLFPAAPPWMASDMGLIEPIERISSHVFFALGINDFPSLYNNISPNPVAAVPSLHAAYATLFGIYCMKLFKSWWKYLAWIYPILIWFGTVYQGEHYLIDAVLGAAYAVIAYIAAPYIKSFTKKSLIKIRASVARAFQLARISLFVK